MPVSATPRAPVGIRPSLRRAWAAFWRSAHADRLDDSMIPAVRRLWNLYEEREAVTALAREHPEAGFRNAKVEIDRHITALERRFFLLPRDLVTATDLPRGLPTFDDEDDDETPDLRR